MPAVLAFIRANSWNRITHAAPVRRLGIVAAGKSWADLMGALDELGLDGAQVFVCGSNGFVDAVTRPLEACGIDRRVIFTERFGA